MAIEFNNSRISGIPGRGEEHTRPEYWKNDAGLFEVRDVYKGSGDKYTGWYILASFNTEDEMKAWASSFYLSYPFANPEGAGPKAVPQPKWMGLSDRTKTLRNLPRSFIPGAPGRTYNPEFRTDGYGVDDDAGECKVYDCVRDGKEVGSFHLMTFPTFAIAKRWAEGYYGFALGGATKNKYVPPLAPMKEAEKKLLLL